MIKLKEKLRYKRASRNYESGKLNKNYLQATNIMIEDDHEPITMSAIYYPLKHNNKKE